MSKDKECVKVMMRCRPMSEGEIGKNHKVIVHIDSEKGEIRVTNPKNASEEKTFTYDMMFDWNSSQEQVYQSAAYPIVESVLEGYNGTVFAYGQTGTGKTFTMEGKQDHNTLKGIIPRAIEHIFRSIEGTPDKQFLVRASFLELYNEDIRDLLSKNIKQKLELREKPETGVYVKDLQAFVIQGVDEMREKLNNGRKNRHVGETKMNQDSSRSHSIFQITVECCEINGTEQSIKVGKLNLVDLAGSERQTKTQASGERFKEAVNINQSLTTLGNVISSLVDKNHHIPYRDSKLTRLLQDSLGGNTKTVMCANVGPADYNYDETLSTLRYATRAKSIQNKPKINEDPKDAMLREYQEEIHRLKDQLRMKMGGEVNENGELVVEVEKVIKKEDDTMVKELEDKLRREKQDLMQNAEGERKRIEEAKNLAEDQKQKLLKKLKQKEEQKQKMYEEQKNLIKQIKAQEEKLLKGDKLKEEAKKKEQELHKARLELEERLAQERRLKEELAAKEATQINVEQRYNSLKEEIDIKTRKLNTLIDKYQEIKDQRNEIEEYRHREKEILMEENREMMSQVKLMDLIIEHLIPEQAVEQLRDNLEFSEEVDDWCLKDKADRQVLPKQPSVYDKQLRGVCEFSRMAISFGDQNPRFRHENILQMDLDLPEQTTEEFTGQVSQKLQETINVALMEEEDNVVHNDNDVTLNINLHNFMMRKQLPETQQRQQSAKRRPASGKKKT